MTQGEQKAIQALMSEELLRNTMLHDLRGNATALLGWQSLIEPQSQKAAAGIERSVEAFVATIRRFSRTFSSGPAVVADLKTIGRSLGVDVDGVDALACVCPRRMEAALALATPKALVVGLEGDEQLRVRILGLDEEGLALLAAPHSGSIVEAVSNPSRTLGVCLFKEVVRGVRGEYEISGDREELSLLLSVVPSSGA